MSWFSRRETVAVAEPEPVVNRQEELERMLSLVDGRLAQLDHQARDFRTQHALRTDRYGRISGMHSNSINGFAAVQREWNIL